MSSKIGAPLIYVAIAIVAIATTSCGVPLKVNVVRYHKLPPAGSGESFSITAPGRGLEAESHKNSVASYLRSYGWKLSPSSSAKYSVTLKYGVDDGRTYQSSAPVYGMTGGGTTYYQGSTGYGEPFSGTSYTPSSYGVVGTTTSSYTFNDHWLLLEIRDSRGNEVFKSACVLPLRDQIEVNGAAKSMIFVLFEGFPGVSGKKEWRKLEF